jgi:hypothetical protein
MLLVGHECKRGAVWGAQQEEEHGEKERKLKTEEALLHTHTHTDNTHAHTRMTHTRTHTDDTHTHTDLWRHDESLQTLFEKPGRREREISRRDELIQSALCIYEIITVIILFTYDILKVE